MPVTVMPPDSSTVPLFLIELATVPPPCSIDAGWTLTKVALSVPPMFVVAPVSCVYVPLTVSEPDTSMTLWEVRLRTWGL